MKETSRVVGPIPWLLLLTFVVVGCEGSGSTGTSQDPRNGCEVSTDPMAVAIQAVEEQPPPVVRRLGPASVFPGAVIYVTGEHLGAPDSGPRLELTGRFMAPDLEGDGQVHTVLFGSVSEDGTRAVFPLSGDELAAWGLVKEPGRFLGTGTLTVYPSEDEGGAGVGFALDVDLAVASWPEPVLYQISIAIPATKTLQVFPEDRLAALADGLLLPEEGENLLVLQGQARRGVSSHGEDVHYELPVEAPMARSEGKVVFSAASFGIQPGTFDGLGWIRCVLTDGATFESEPIPVSIEMEPPVLSGLDPTAASRGQWVTLVGRGFLPPTDRGATVFRIDGVLHPDDGSPDIELTDFEVSPEDYRDNSTMRMAFRTHIEHGDGQRFLSGLTAQPGRFEGSITPIVTWDGHEVVGIPYREGFRIAPTRQVVYLKFLPGFTVSLKQTWGLKNVERELRNHILATVRRDYTGINVQFTERRPEDFLEYTVMEIGGIDPNGRGLFGLDNTTGEEGDSPKDVGNLRLQEVVGGHNARAEEQGYLSYGGVFLESFRHFTTWVDDPSDMASSRFDDIFGPVAPFLCGDPVEPDEYPGGPRDDIIAEAIRVLGNLVASTITHELGHSLGLSLPYGDPFEFHNLYDTPNAIMDSGQYRPFEERAEIDGFGPAVFTPENREYLERILPVDR